MVGGQYVDVAGPRRRTRGLRRLHELKTGRLIGASVGASCCWRVPTDLPQSRIARFAAELGVLFQIVDDILDVTGDEAELGQAAGLRRAPRQARPT